MWYAVDLSGKEVISGEEVLRCGTDRFLVGKDGRFALADNSGNFLTDFIRAGCNTWGDGLICVKAPD